MRALRVPLVIALLFGVLWAAGSVATAQPGKGKGRKYPPVTPSILPSKLTPVPTPTTPPSDGPSAPPSVEPSRQPREPLPFTGADLTRFVLIGAGLTAAGTVAVRIARRRAGS